MLFLDIGNTTLSWAWAEPNGGLSAVFRCFHHNHQVFEKQCLDQEFSIVYIANVASDDVMSFYCQLLSKKAIYICQTSKTCGDLKNGYQDYKQLGIDRWLGMIGSWTKNKWQFPFYFLDAGTTTTLDYVDNFGHHQGGIILPSIENYMQAVFKDISVKQDHFQFNISTSEQFGVTTNLAVYQGYCHLIRHYIEKTEIPIYLSGGRLKTIKMIVPSVRFMETEDAIFLGMLHEGVIWQKC